MKATIISNSFSIFGEYSYILNNQNKLVDSLKELNFRAEVGKERDNKGNEFSCMRFLKNNKVLIFHHNRIDVNQNAVIEIKAEDDFIDFVKEVAYCLSDFNVKGNRIAYNEMTFADNAYNYLLIGANLAFNIDNNYGKNADEFMMRLNHKTLIDNEEFNSILSFQDGVVGNNKTKEQKKAIMISNDINTLFQNKEMRFELDSAINYLEKMMTLAAERTQKTVDLLTQ